MNKNAFFIVWLLVPTLSTTAQTLQQVTAPPHGTTTNSITIQNEQGLTFGVDASTSYTVSAHSLKPSPVGSRTLRFDCSTILGDGGWEFYNSHIAGSLMYLKQSGHVGIGTATPTSQLHLSADTDHALTLSRANGTYGFRMLRSANAGIVSFQIGTAASNAWETKIQMGEGEGANTKLLLNPDGGNVGIGMPYPTEKLTVDGTVLATKVKVKQNVWPDYVFGATYPLRSLPDTEQFIRRHQHLPGIPSAAEVAANGLNIGDNQAKLLEKIEELTLHLIAQNKTITEQQQQLATIDKRLKELEAAGK